MSAASNIEPYVLRTFHPEDAPEDFRQAINVRTIVFVEEQNVPPDRELDEYEGECLHFLLLDTATDEPLGTGRMREYQEGCQMRPVAKIERIAVMKTRRGQKLGERLMWAILETVRAQGYDQAILDAQVPVLGFYEKFGFVAEGEEFMDANIPHYRMRLVF